MPRGHDACFDNPNIFTIERVMTNTSNRWNILVFAFIIVFLCGIACGCGGGTSIPEPSKEDSSISRADPGFMQYLERQSMLSVSSDLAGMVIGTSLTWRDPGSTPHPQTMLKNWSVWMRFHPQTVLAPGTLSPLGQLSNPVTWVTLEKAGVKAMYVAPSSGSGGLWEFNHSTDFSDNEDIIQYEFARTLGKHDDFVNIARQAAQRNGMTGGDILPASTGIGPDFYLAARDLRSYPGIYCMVEVPKALWSTLPNLTREWDVAPLGPATVNTLHNSDVIPTSMLQDHLTFLPPSGWAATNAIRGADGNMRRWVFRYFDKPRMPVLNWQDPSGNARKLMSGSVIREVGLLGNGLSGIRVLPLVGLEGSSKAVDYDQDSVLSPLRSGVERSLADPSSQPVYGLALEAASHLARQTRSYGGWSWCRDEAHLPFMERLLVSGPDFVHDSLFSPAAEHALLTGNTALIRFMVQEGLAAKLDFSRLVHSTSGHDGISYLLPHLEYLRSLPESMPESSKKQTAHDLLQNTLTELSFAAMPPGTQAGDSLLAGRRLYTTPAGLAALAIGLDSSDTPNAEETALIRRGHSLLVFFKSMQPGITMLTGQDMVGLMPLNWRVMSKRPEDWNKRLGSMGCYAILSMSEGVGVNQLGLPKGKSLYGPIDLQVHTPDSFLKEVGAMFEARERLAIPDGTLVASLPTRSESTVALVTKSKDGRRISIAISNFSRKDVKENISLAGNPELLDFIIRATPQQIYGDAQALAHQSDIISLYLPGWGKSLIVLDLDGPIQGFEPIQDTPNLHNVPINPSSVPSTTLLPDEMEIDGPAVELPAINEELGRFFDSLGGGNTEELEEPASDLPIKLEKPASSGNNGQGSHIYEGTINLDEPEELKNAPGN